MSQFSSTWSTLLLWYLIAFLLIQILAQVNGPGGKIGILLKSFSNPKLLDASGSCCDLACTTCDYYFVFCIMETSNGKCVHSLRTKNYDNYKHVVFSWGENLGGKSNPLEFAFKEWKGRLVLQVNVWDDDSISSDDRIDSYYINKAVTPIPGVSRVTWTSDFTLGRGSPSTMIVRYYVRCNSDYYGPSCTTYCVACDDSTGHYTCDLSTGGKVCRPDWFGAGCLTYCKPHDDDTNGHYTCDTNTGVKVCRHGWHGNSCNVYCVHKNDSKGGHTCDAAGQKICLVNWYPQTQCDVYCNHRNDSLAGYTCDRVSGKKICRFGWRGPECNCQPRNDSTAGYMCNSTTGAKHCLVGWYGLDCNIYCLARNDSKGHYTCNPTNGAKECLANWFGDSCATFCLPQNGTAGHNECSVNGTSLCKRNWYGETCSVYCVPRADGYGRYDCNPLTGSKMCQSNWYGVNCSVSCVPKNSDYYGHYNCSNADGSRVCHVNWYQLTCTKFCLPRNDSRGHYICNQPDGSIACLPDWHGTECNVYCRPRDDSYGHYTCDLDGTKECLQGWYNTNCTTYCLSRNDSRGHYTCDAWDGSKICDHGWFGESCTRHCLSRNDNQGHYTCDRFTGEKVCLEGWHGTNCALAKVVPTTHNTEAPSTTPSPQRTAESGAPIAPSEPSAKPVKNDELIITDTHLTLMVVGIVLVLSISAGSFIIVRSRRSLRKFPDKPFPYLRQQNSVLGTPPKKRNDKKKKMSARDVLSEYDDYREMDDVRFQKTDNILLKVHEISWTNEGERQTDDRLVMYNNPLFSASRAGRCPLSVDLGVGTDWDTIFRTDA